MIFIARVVIAILAAFWVASSLASSAAAQVVAIGDSGTEGTGVGVGEAHPAQLEALLNARVITSQSEMPASSATRQR